MFSAFSWKDMIARYRALVLFLLILLSSNPGVAQLSDSVYRRSGIVNGNNTQTVFGNWGVIGQPGEQGKRGAWKYSTNGYIGDMSIFLGIEFPIRDYNGDGIADTVHSVITCPVARPTTRRDEDPITGKSWTFEPRPGYFAPEPNQSIAISNQPETWPAFWPDHPEWGAGVWNGLYGPNMFVGSQETYFQMDDQNDEHFNFAANNSRGIAFHPDSTNLARLGAGIRMGVRYIQVSHPLFKDVLYRVFDIKNESKCRYTKVVFGTLTGTYIGVTSTEDVGEYNDDATVYFASSNSILSWDFGNNTTRNPRWQGPVGMFGEAFVQSPNQNRIASCNYFAPSGSLSLFYDDSLWRAMLPGRFVHPPSIIQDTVAVRGEDGDYMYASEYFSLDTSETRRVVSVIAYGYGKGEIHQKELLARALWNAHFDTLLVQQGITITDFSSHRFLSGIVPVNWTTQQSGGNVDIWYSPDAGTNWQPVVRGATNTGTFSWNTNSVEDCSFGLLRVFVNDANGNPYSFNQSYTYFTVNNASNGSPFVRIMNEELRDTSVIEQQTYSLRLLLGDPESLPLAVSAFYRVSSSSLWNLYETFSAPSDTNAQMHSVRLVDLPNSDHFQLKLQVWDGSTFNSDSTAAFMKRTPRSNIPPTNFHVLSGFAEVPVAVHIVDPSRVRSDTYVITFDDTSSFTGKTFSVYNRTLGTYVLQNNPVQPLTESPPFDGLALYTEDVLTSCDGIRSRWSRFPREYNVSVLDVEFGTEIIRGYRQPNEYRIVFHDSPVDTSIAIESLGLPAVPIPYQVFNVQTNDQVRVGALEFPFTHHMVFVENVRGRDRFTWETLITFAPPDSAPHNGDTLFIITKKGLSIYDSLQVSDLPVSVGDIKEVPGEFKLYQNYPNPFNPSTVLRFQIPTRSQVSLKVFDVLGREVVTLVNEVMPAGEFTTRWDAANCSSGVYFYRLSSGGHVDVKKMLLLK